MKLKRASIFTKLVILALIVYAVISLIGTRERLAVAEANRDALQAEVNTYTRENAELEYDTQHADDPEVIADIARSKLGLVMPGEKIFYDVSN